MKKIDLHIHTNKSDGSFSPSEVVDIAKRRGLSAIAITDHDNTNGIKEALEAADNEIEVIQGIEISSGYMGKSIHLLGYLYDIDSCSLDAVTQWLNDDRENRNWKIAAKMRDDGINITLDEMKERFPGAAIGRPHFATIFMEYGMADSVEDAFHKYLNPGQRYYFKRNFIPLEDAIGLVNEAGGKAVVAHPFQYRMDNDALRKMISFCKDAGLCGIECRYSGYTEPQIKYLMDIAGKFELCATGGSDFHGSAKPDIAIGTGKGDLCVPYEMLENLKNYKL